MSVPGGDEGCFAALSKSRGQTMRAVLQKGLVSVDAKTGKFLWRYTNRWQSGSIITRWRIRSLSTAARSGGGG